MHNCDIRLALAPRPRRHGAPWPSPEGDPRCRPPFDEPISHGGRRQRRDVAADLREFGPPARRRQPDAVQVTIDVRFKVQRTAGKLFPKPRPRLDLESERVTQPVKGVTHARANMHGLSGRFQTQQLASRPLSRCMRDGMPMGPRARLRGRSGRLSGSDEPGDPNGPRGSTRPPLGTVMSEQTIYGANTPEAPGRGPRSAPTTYRDGRPTATSGPC